VPDRLRRPCDVLTGNFTICPPVIAQWACLAAFDETSYDELDGHVRRYAENRRLLLDGLPRLGITELAPADGAFYVYADVGHLSQDTMGFCHDLLARTGVAMAPGIDFDTEVGNRFVRLSFPGDAAVIEAALERLSTAL
jgi:aspartate/methionine/tyrosine aminotransferase